MLTNICQFVCTTNKWIAKIISPLIVLMTILVAVDVVLRYIFNSPILWAWDVNIQLFGVFTMFGAAFTLLNRGHVGVDVLVMDWSPKKKTILEVITFPFFLMGVGILLWGAIPAAWESVLALESYSSYIALPVYPLKVVLAIAIFLLFLQGIANLIFDINSNIRAKGEK
jgi:TRAP-type mannitol/chloroaromatic compound transport system permease small subunit